MKKLFSYLSFMAFLLFLATNANAQAKFEPPDGKCYIFVGQSLEATGGTNAQDDGYYDNVTDAELPVGFTAYTNPLGLGLLEPGNVDAGNLGGTLSNGLTAGTGVWDNDKCEANGVEFSMQSAFYQQSAINLGYFFTQAFGDWIGNPANRNQWDQNTRVMARFLHALEVPVFLRLGYEFDFQYHQFGASPQFYKETFRHIVEVIEDEIGVDHQIAFVFQSGSRNSYGGMQNIQQVEEWYPGDDVVDWVGISYFGNNDRYDFMTQLAVNHSKPLMICESAPQKNNLNEAWFNDIVSYIEQNDVIKAWSYINFDWDGTGGAGPDDRGCWPLSDQWGDSRIQSNPNIEAFWNDLINNNNHHLGTGDERWVTKWRVDGADNSIRYMQNPAGNGAFATFTALPAVAKPGDNITITNNSLNGVSYLWDFGNGNTSTSADPGNIVYNEQGTYVITLTVTDGQGGTNTATRSVKVSNCLVAHISDFDSQDELDFIRTNDIGGPGVDSIADLSIEDGKLIVETAIGHTEFSAFIEIAVNEGNPIHFDYGGGDEVTLVLRAKSTEPVALRSTIVSDQGITAQTNDLQLATSNDDNTFDFIVTEDFQTFKVNFNNDLWDQWVSQNSIFCPASDTANCPSGGVKDPIEFIHLKPNPGWAGNFFVTGDVNGVETDFDFAYTGTLTIEFVSLGADPDSVCSIMVGLDDFDGTQTITNMEIYPVPSDNIVNISVYEETTGTVEIINLLGETVYAAPYKGGNLSIDVSTLMNSNYILKYSNANKVGIRRIQVGK